MSGIAKWTGKSPCGTRGAYTRGCRCEPCRAANAKRYRDRSADARARADEVTPSGPPIADVMVRAGVSYSIKRCPGANGNACVRPGGSWLRTGNVCVACVHRVVMWDGLVPTTRVRAHLRKLSKRGIGRDQISDVTGMSTQRIDELRTGKGSKRIRAQAERRILAVDESARADGMPVAAGPTKRLVELLVKRGFRRYEISRLLGHSAHATALQMNRDRVLLSTAAKVERLFARVQRGEIAPKSAKPAPLRLLPGVSATLDELRELRDRGVDLVSGRELELQLEALRDLQRMRRAG